MDSKNQDGSVLSMVLIIVLAVLLAGASAAAIWAYGGRQNFKNNSAKISAAAVSAALDDQRTQLQKQFDEQSKQPLKNFKGPDTYGTVSFNYPRTWSAYIDQSSSAEPINGYFFPDQVPGIGGDSAYALRVELLSTTYEQAISQFKSKLTSGSLTAIAYLPEKLKGVANAQPGTLLTGNITDKFSGSLLVIKVRDKTLEVSTQSKDFLPDFNNSVLSSLSFAP